MLIKFIQYGFDYEVHSKSRYMNDYQYESAIKMIKHHFGRNIKINELSLSEINMETPEGYYVDM